MAPLPRKGMARSVSPPPRKRGTDWYGRWHLPVAMLLVLCWGAGASAASVSASRGEPPRPHHCKCGTGCRGATCCCDSHGEAPHPAEGRPSSRPTATGDSPCVKSAPCGQPGIPSPSVDPTWKPAGITSRSGFWPDLGRGLLPPLSRPVFPIRRPSRLDRPPERQTTA